MFVTIVIGAVILIAALLGLAATRPGTFHVQRTKSVQASPEEIFALVNDFRKWGSWSPYEKLDPAMKRTCSGAADGKGAVYEWAGNSKAGHGRMEITDANPPQRMTIKLDFLKPMEGHYTTEFTFQSNDGSTSVTWAMHGSLSYLCKVMGLFFNMDRMVGKEFETGLANIKSITEKRPEVRGTESQSINNQRSAAYR